MNFKVMLRSANFFKSLLWARILNRRVPLRVGLQLTKYCNMRCSYCYADFERYKTAKELSTDEIFNVVDELHALGCRWIWFLGGEPMMREDFGRIIDYVHSKGMFCDMNSNGILINKDNLSTVKKLDGVAISIDGNEETNDFYRGKGMYQKAIKAVELLVANGVSVRIHSILTKKTAAKLDQVAERSRQLGVTFNYCEVLKKETAGDDILSDKEHEDFYKRYLDYKKRGAPIMHSIESIEYMLKWPKTNGTVIYHEECSGYDTKDYVPCLSGDLLCFVDLDGGIYACNGTWGDGLNYKEVGFKKAWDYLAQRKCVGCRCVGMTSLHSIFGLSEKSVMHALLSIAKIK
ncbi:MAG: radical SAM protein [Deltaproteobacteria bacterium]|nr:radical SAM protein [Deltaproteobacteria bacterium]